MEIVIFCPGAVSGINCGFILSLIFYWRFLRMPHPPIAFLLVHILKKKLKHISDFLLSAF